MHAFNLTKFQVIFICPGRKAAVNTCAFNKDGSLIAGALYDGSIQVWKNSPPFVSIGSGNTVLLPL